MTFNSPRIGVTSQRYEFFNQPLSKPKFHSNLKFNLDNSKTLSTDSQLLQTNRKHLKSSFKLHIINEISSSYLFSKLGSSSSNQHFKSQNCLKTLSINSNCANSQMLQYWCQQLQHKLQSSHWEQQMRSDSLARASHPDIRSRDLPFLGSGFDMPRSRATQVFLFFSAVVKSFISVYRPQ